MRVGYLNAEGNALSANFTFSHLTHFLSIHKEEFIISVTDNIISEIAPKFKYFFGNVGILCNLPDNVGKYPRRFVKIL